MRPAKVRFITVCQQLLAVGAALAVLGPAADVVTLDVVTHPGAAAQRILGQQPEALAPTQVAGETSRVETAAVDPVVTEVPLEPADSPVSVDEEATDTGERPTGRREFVTEPQEVEGYGAVGVTWDGEAVEEDAITMYARTRTDGEWSGWSELEYHDDHGPDPMSPEGRKARPGSEPLIIGDVEAVQTKVVTDGADPADLEMAVVDPGKSKGSAEEAPAIDTGAGDASGTELASSEGDLALQAGSFTRKPTIYSRAQWGADERMRDASSLRYGEVHAGFVHHTVNANDYTRDEVPGIIRSIYAYHTRSKGWSDIGYNFLVDRFGRIWEGRYGGVDRPVVGAHTLGLNDWSFAGSAIGNYDIAAPSSAMVNAFGQLMAWKLSLHGVDASSTRQQVGDYTLPAINGHRDSPNAATACPGRYLYAKVPTIRSIAETSQADWSGRDKVTDLTGSSYPDLVLRNAADGKAYVVSTGGLLQFAPARTLSSNWSRFDVKVLSPDLTGDGLSDMVVREPTGAAGVRPGNGAGGFARRVKALDSLFRGFDLVTPVGRFNSDARNDVIARYPATGRLYLFRGDGAGGFSRVALADGYAGVDRLVSTGDVTGDGFGDLYTLTDGTLTLLPSNGAGAFAAPRAVSGSWNHPTLTGFGDFTADGKNDLLVRSSAGNTYVAPGLGNGQFGPKLGPLAGGFGSLAGFTGGQVLDGDDPDVLGFAGDALVAVPHTGRQNLLPRISTGSSFSDVNQVLSVGDWDRDGDGDLVTRVASSGQLQLRLGDGSGRFAAPTVLSSYNFNGVRLLSAVGDTTGDGLPDLMGQPTGSSMRIYPGNGTAGLKTSYISHSAISATSQLGLGRWNADGAPDAAFRNGSKLFWMKGNGPGGLYGSTTTFSNDLSAYDWVVAPGDVDGNGRPDLIARTSNGLLWMLPGTATGFGPRQYLGSGFEGYNLVG